MAHSGGLSCFKTLSLWKQNLGPIYPNFLPLTTTNNSKNFHFKRSCPNNWQTADLITMSALIHSEWLLLVAGTHHVFYSRDNLCKDQFAFQFIQLPPGGDPGKQVSSTAILHHQIKLPARLKHLIKTHYIGVAELLHAADLRERKLLALLIQALLVHHFNSHSLWGRRKGIGLGVGDRVRQEVRIRTVGYLRYFRAWTNEMPWLKECILASHLIKRLLQHYFRVWQKCG